MLLGALLMVGGVGFMNQQPMWVFQIAGACMVMLALFYLSKRLHEQTEEVASLKQLLNDRNDDNGAVPHVR
jgi:type VI protein secretion system component VasF